MARGKLIANMTVSERCLSLLNQLANSVMEEKSLLRLDALEEELQRIAGSGVVTDPVNTYTITINAVGQAVRRP